MGRAARERQLALFSLERCVSDYDHLYRALSGTGVATAGKTPTDQ
jgi:hypothetical protein